MDSFDVLQIVGEGWFGKILLVEHKATDQEMVLKGNTTGEIRTALKVLSWRMMWWRGLGGVRKFCGFLFTVISVELFVQLIFFIGNDRKLF